MNNNYFWVPSQLLEINLWAQYQGYGFSYPPYLDFFILDFYYLDDNVSRVLDSYAVDFYLVPIIQDPRAKDLQLVPAATGRIRRSPDSSSCLMQMAAEQTSQAEMLTIGEKQKI